MKIAVFVSGRGSNLQAILNNKELSASADVTSVYSNREECGAFEIALKHGAEVFYTGNGGIAQSELADHLLDRKIELIVLAGYLKLIPAEVIYRFDNRIINIHPALLPSFGGKGMYGMKVHKAVYESSAKVSGATVHFVDNAYDTGRIIAQECVDISRVSSTEEIAEKVLEIEHRLLPKVILKFSENKIKISGNRVIIED